MIVEQSNLYASTCMGDSFSSWNPISIDEIKAYMGFMILMGLVKLPSLNDYWKKDEVFHYTPIADRISRDRFYEISRYLHFVDNSTLLPYGHPNYDKLAKVRPVINHMNQQFLKVYQPGCNQSINEAMIAFKGRSSLKQYIPNKPVKRGFKIWMRADSMNGYVSEFEVYTGKKNGTTEKGLGASVVKSLSEKIYNKHHHIFFDNYFTSFDLLLDLLRNNTYGCGTIRSNRIGFPSEFKPHLKKGLPNRGVYNVVLLQQVYGKTQNQ